MGQGKASERDVACAAEKKAFTAKPSNLGLVRTIAQMKDNLSSRAEQVVDARGPAKFDGTQEDVFTFKRLGHMPNARVTLTKEEAEIVRKALQEANDEIIASPAAGNERFRIAFMHRAREQGIE